MTDSLLAHKTQQLNLVK